MKLITSKSPAGIIPCTDKRKKLKMMEKGEFRKIYDSTQKRKLTSNVLSTRNFSVDIADFLSTFFTLLSTRMCVCVYVCV